MAVPLENQLSLDYVASLGVLDRLALSLTLPTVLYQNGDEVGAQLGDGRLPQTAIGDAAFGVKATLVPTSSLGGFGLAALARVTAPTGDSRSYVSDGAVAGELRLLGELKLILLTVQGSAGAKIRGEQRTFVGEEFGHELPWGVAVGLRPQALGIDKDGRWTWTLETRGQVAMSPKFEYEAMLDICLITASPISWRPWPTLQYHSAAVASRNERPSSAVTWLPCPDTITRSCPATADMSAKGCQSAEV